MLLLSRLRRAVKKVRLLLSFDVQRWRIASMLIGGGRSLNARTHRRLSFNEPRPAGFAAAAADEMSEEEESGSSRGHQQLQRTVSNPSDDNQEYDIDQRAEMFIANFRKQLQMERQVSLEVRYYRGNSFDWRSP